MLITPASKFETFVPAKWVRKGLRRCKILINLTGGWMGVATSGSETMTMRAEMFVFRREQHYLENHGGGELPLNYLINLLSMDVRGRDALRQCPLMFSL